VKSGFARKIPFGRPPIHARRWSQEQSSPHHRANAAQDDLELVNARHLGAWHGAQCTATDYTAKRFPRFAVRTSNPLFYALQLLTSWTLLPRRRVPQTALATISRHTRRRWTTRRLRGQQSPTTRVAKVKTAQISPSCLSNPFRSKYTSSERILSSSR